VILRALILGAALLTAAAPSPKPIKPKECPPPEGFRAILHLLDNDAPTLQAYPVQGVSPPKDLFKYFGKDMEPRCALERTFDDLQKFKSKYAQLGEFKPKEGVTPKQLLQQFQFSVRALKRYQWCLLLYNAEEKEHEYVGSQVPEIKEGVESMFALGIDAGTRYVEGLEFFLKSFKGLENSAIEAKKRLDADAGRASPRAAKEIEADQRAVDTYEKRFKEISELERSVQRARSTYTLVSGIHSAQKWSWPAAGNPAGVLAPLSRRLLASKKALDERGK
jgi:hypothetical protein